MVKMCVMWLPRQSGMSLHIILGWMNMRFVSERMNVTLKIVRDRLQKLRSFDSFSACLSPAPDYCSGFGAINGQGGGKVPLQIREGMRGTQQPAQVSLCDTSFYAIN